MPSLNLRLTDEEHALLVAAAGLSRRSLQQEILARVFAGPLPERTAVSGEVLPEVPVDAYPLGARELPAVERSVGSGKRPFRPDFKGGSK